jgi:hypothetical protein
MNGKCEKCFYYSGNNVLLPHCHHFNSAIAPGWEKCYEGKDCPEFVDKESYSNKLKEIIEAHMEDFKQNVVKENKPQSEQREFIVTHGTPMLAVTTESIIAKINFIDNYYGNLFLNAIKQGQNIVIKPYGHAEHDNDGNIKNFNLVGFNIDKFIQEEIKEDKPQVEQVSSKHHYIGKYVHAGGELNGIVGHIVDVKHESDDIFGEELWFYIKDEEDGTIHRYCKEEIQEIVIGITYKDLE